MDDKITSSKPRKIATTLTIELKLKVLREMDELKLSKKEMARKHGISPTSVSRILNSRELLESISDEDVKKRKVGSDKVKTVKRNLKRSRAVPIEDENAMEINSTEFDMDYSSSCSISSTQSRDLLCIPQYDDPEASLEKALKQLEEYTFELLIQSYTEAVENLHYPNMIDGLYEMYEELMENEFGNSQMCILIN